MLKLKSIFALILPIAILCSCSNDEVLLSKSVVSEDDPISVVFKNYLNEHEGTRSSLDGVVITNVEHRHYSITENGVEESITRSKSIDFDVVRADFSKDGKNGYAYLTTDNKAEGVYYYTDNGVISDTIENKALAIVIDAIPSAVASVLSGGIADNTTVPDVISQKGVGPLMKSQWGQEYPFNSLIPICYCSIHPNGAHQYAGCTNIAAAQVIAYCRRFTGTYYGTKDINFARIVRIGTTGFQVTSEDILQVGSLVREISMQVGSDYGCSKNNGTGAPVKNVSNYLKDLGYSCSYVEGKLDLERIKKSIYDLDKRVPVIVSGFQKGGRGHTWVVDGVKMLSDGDEYHNNWGWRGLSDGWVKGSVLTVVPSSISSEGANYNTNTCAIYITAY